MGRMGAGCMRSRRRRPRSMWLSRRLALLVRLEGWKSTRSVAY